MEKSPLPPGQSSVKKAKIILWIGIVIIIGLGTLVAVYFVFVREATAPMTNNANEDANINLVNNTANKNADADRELNANTKTENIPEDILTLTYTYTSDQRSFSLEVPIDWKVVKQPVHNEERKPLISAYDEQGTAANALTVSFYNNPDATLNDWLTEHKQELIRSHEDIIESEPDYSGADRQIVMAEMKELFKHAHCYVQADDDVYEIYLSSELDDWPQYQDIFNLACSSFQSLSDTTGTSDWLTYENEEVGFSFNYPAEYGEVESLIAEGTSGKKFTATFTQNDDIVIGGDTPDYSYPTEAGFLDMYGYTENEKGYFLETPTEIKLYPVTLIKKLDSTADGIIVETTMWEQDVTGAVFNLEGDEFTGVNFYLKSQDRISIQEFEEVVSTVQNYLDTSDWLTYENEAGVLAGDKSPATRDSIYLRMKFKHVSGV